MSEGQQQIDVPVATNMSVNHVPGLTGLFFQTAREEVRIAIPDSNLTQLAAVLLNHIVDLAAVKVLATPQAGEKLTVHPINVAGMAASPGRTPTEVILAVNVGPTLLTFAVDATTLQSLCNFLLPKLTEATPETRN